ncbi:hypothetical protein D3C86_855080 [compost metagenome]
MLEEISKNILSARFLSLTRFSNDPKPIVDLLPETFTSAKSASLAFILAVAAQPPRSSNSVSLISLNQTCALLSNPSSVVPFALLRDGFNIPSIYTRTLLISGCPFTIIVLPLTTYLKGLLMFHGNPSTSMALFRSNFAFWKSSSSMSILF